MTEEGVIRLPLDALYQHESIGREANRRHRRRGGPWLAVAQGQVRHKAPADMILETGPDQAFLQATPETEQFRRGRKGRQRKRRSPRIAQREQMIQLQVEGLAAEPFSGFPCPRYPVFPGTAALAQVVKGQMVALRIYPARMRVAGAQSVDYARDLHALRRGWQECEEQAMQWR